MASEEIQAEKEVRQAKAVENLKEQVREVVAQVTSGYDGGETQGGQLDGWELKDVDQAEARLRYPDADLRRAFDR